MAKLTIKEQAELRANFYEAIEDTITLQDTVVGSEPSTSGILFHLEDGTVVEVTVVVKDDAKFDINKVRTAYAEKVAKAQKRAEDAAQKAADKLAKAEEKAAKLAEKTEMTVEVTLEEDN